MTTDREQTTGPGDPARVAELLDAVVAQIDEGQLGATSPERAYLVGVATSLRAMTLRD